MADSGKQSPLGINVLGSLLNSTGLTINPVAAGYMGSSNTNANYTFGTMVSQTALRLLTWAINDGYLRGPANSNATLSNATYNNLITIGSTTLPALGNAVPPTYVVEDPANVWSGQATSGYPLSGNTGQEQSATWLPYDTTNTNASVTQWGYVRLHALQAWNEFNWNGASPTQTTPSYKDFCGSFQSSYGYLTAANQTIQAASNSNTFLDGVYSNMNDLISADIAGVSLSTSAFGTDLVNLGNAIDLKNISTFGLPSNLLVNLSKNSAITQDLNLALLSAGMSTTDISSIVSGKTPNVTPAQEQMIYGAFLIIAGVNLTTILAAMKCNTQGLNTLADLLNVKMLFPNSYPSLTVPVYNGTMGLPTNSKTYYLIYNNGGVNAAIDTPAIQSYVGTIIPSGTPPTFSSTLDPANYNQLPTGFASYLVNIIPYDQALAAGAFSYSMQQIRNIRNCDIQKFAKVVQGIENTSDLNLVAGTSKPTNQDAINAVTSVTALGSGPNGSYTMSDFFGCMSGLPYPWQLIQQRISQLQTTKLYNIYQQLLLAVEWEAATASGSGIICSPAYTGPGTYTITGLTFTDAGGGYGRGTAPNPTITFTSGLSNFTTTGIVDEADANAGSNEGGTFGRLVGITPVTVSLTAAPSTYTVSIQCPPTATLAVNTDGTVATGGTNTTAGTSGWPTTMNAVVQAYITQANTEIANIQQTGNTTAVNNLQAYWNICGGQLKREQRSRYTYIAPVSIPLDSFVYQYPASLSTFVDTIPSLSLDTSPHGAAQTLEAISDFTTAGGQSIVAMGRQERNQARLQSVGINLDNNIPATVSSTTQNTLTTNGTVPGAASSEGILSLNGQTYTIPAWPSNINNTGQNVAPTPQGVYVPPSLAAQAANGVPGFQQLPNTVPGDITPILDGTSNPVVSTTVPVGPAIATPSNSIVVIAPAAQYNPNNLPPNLDPNFTSSTLLPASLNVPEAIHQVTTCNCDCWME
jgi:hypothetical protein